MKDIYFIVRDEIVARLDNSIELKSKTLLAGVWTLDVQCSVKWARVGKTITDSNDVVFNIVSVDYEENTISVTDNGSVPSNSILIELPYFFLGTPLKTNVEWKQFSSNEMKKVPFIWMVEPTKEREQPDTSSNERESDLFFILLDHSKVNKWLTKEVHENRLQALYNLVDAIKTAINTNPKWFQRLAVSVDLKNFTRFGTETTNGFDANIIDAELAGVEMRFTLTIRRQSCVNC